MDILELTFSNRKRTDKCRTPNGRSDYIQKFIT